MSASQLVLLEGYTSTGQELFNKRSASIVHSLNTRMRKRGFADRLSLDAGRRTLAAGVGKPCKYCGVTIKIQTMSADHRLPIARGGSPFAVECICKSCNAYKGELSGDEYVAFRAFLKTISPEGASDVLGRLKAGAFGIRMMAQFAGKPFKDREKKPKKESSEPWPYL